MSCILVCFFYMYYAATMIVEYAIREFLDDYNDSSRRGGGGRGGLVQQRFDSLGTPVKRYFEAWNRRNVPLALSCFEDMYTTMIRSSRNRLMGRPSLLIIRHMFPIVYLNHITLCWMNCQWDVSRTEGGCNKIVFKL